ncbi:hypothetical protein R3P38DRAFT_3095364 [Favolaschia claudopus]|uniref:Uncharacterized protein n=1 Tax=Favolaschia claudopus TaxID=2862362 RepID=A0AAV9ZRB4_9AGAR
MAGTTTTAALFKNEEDSESKSLLTTTKSASSTNPASQNLAAAARALSEAHKALALANSISIPDASDSMAALEQSNQKLQIQVAKLTVELKEERTRAEAMREENAALKGEVEGLKKKEKDEAELVEKLDELAGEMHARTGALTKKLSATKAAGGTVKRGLKRKAAERTAEAPAGASTGGRGSFIIIVAGVVIPTKRQRLETQKFPKRVRFGDDVQHVGLLARLAGPRRSTSPSLSNQPWKAFAPLVADRRGSPTDARYRWGEGNIRYH